jgi:signal transduction histidine kinase
VTRLEPPPIQPVRPWQKAISLRLTLVIFNAAIALFPNLAIAYFLGNALPPVWGVALLFLSVGFGWFVANALLQPINALRLELAGLAAERQLSTMQIGADETQPSEVRALREAFSKLLASLHDEQQKRSAFMATLVHDLKTPIIAANHVLEAIERDDHLSRETRIELIASIKNEFEGLLRLVQQMVDAHRFEREDVVLTLEPMSLNDLATRVAKRLEPSASERGVRINVQGSGQALAASNELERALLNLGGNAVRYAASSVTLDVSHASLTVSDDGPGLPAPLEELIKPFNSQQVELAGQKFTAGTGGLGLFIAYRIAQAHGGSLEQLPAKIGTHLRLNLRSA